MAVEITMPRLSDSMEEGVVVKWLVAVGGTVEAGRPLVEIDTDKATMVYEAEASGTLLEQLVAEGDSAPIGAPIARVGASAEAAEPTPEAPAERRRRANASPVARRLAAELGVALDALTGSGPGGLITREDVEAAAPAVAPTAERQEEDRGDTRIEELTRLQRTVARRMTEGHATPDFAVEVEIDMTRAASLRQTLSETDDAAPTFNDLVVKAAALALREFPRVNGSYTERGIALSSRINVGIAVATEGGLVVPTIRDADRKSLAEIAREAKELAGKVRDGTIAPTELDGGTFTVSNLGGFGVRRFLPIVNPPQAAILGVGKVARAPAVAADGSIVARELMSATLVCDHRVVYGAEAAQFLARVTELLEQPDQLAD